MILLADDDDDVPYVMLKNGWAYGHRATSWIQTVNMYWIIKRKIPSSSFYCSSIFISVWLLVVGFHSSLMMIFQVDQCERDVMVWYATTLNHNVHNGSWLEEEIISCLDLGSSCAVDTDSLYVYHVWMKVLSYFGWKFGLLPTCFGKGSFFMKVRRLLLKWKKWIQQNLQNFALQRKRFF